MELRLLALDIDDTLLGLDGRLSEANRLAVLSALEQGVAVTLITGRRYRRSAERFAAELGIAGPLGCHYGRAIVLHPGGEVVAQHYLSAAVCRLVLGLAAEWRLYPSLCADELLFFPDSRNGVPVLDRTFPAAVWVPDLLEVLAERGDRVMSMALSGPHAALARTALAREIEAGNVVVHNQRAAGQGDDLAVILAGRHDKGTALLDICAQLGVPASCTMAMGDSEADIPLLRAAGLGVAMPWAAEEVRQAADRVATGPHDDAVAREIMAVLAGLAG